MNTKRLIELLKERAEIHEQNAKTYLEMEQESGGILYPRMMRKASEQLKREVEMVIKWIKENDPH